jgi:hypothetical protein
MPQVTIPGIGNVNFPDAMSDQEIMAQARAMQEKANQPIFDPKDLGIGQLISGGFGRSVEGLKGTVVDLIPALGASLVGKDKYARDQLKEYGERMAAAEELYPTAYKSYKDISGIGSILPFAAETIGEIGPDIAGFMVGAGVGTYGGKKLALNALEKQVREEAAEFAAKKKLSAEAAQEYADRLVARTQAGEIGTRVAGKGKGIGLKTGIGGTSAAINIPDVFQSIYEDTGELAPGVALTIGSLVSALDAYLPSKILSQLGPKGKERIAAEMLKKSTVVPTTFKRAFGTEILKTATGEALTEGTQEALTKFASQIVGSKDPFFSEKNIDQIITSSLKGFIGGGVFGAPGAAFEAKRIKDERNRLIAERQAGQEDQAAQQFSSLQQTQPDLFGEQAPATPYDARQDGILTPRQQDIAAMQQAEAMQQLPTSESPRFYQEQQAAQPSPGQQAFDLQGGMTPEQQMVAERDRQNQEMNQLYLEEAQQQLQQARDRAATAKEILDEEIFLTDERVRLGQIKRTEAERISLLLPIINNLELGTEDSITLFQQGLRSAGYNNLELTEAEQRLLQRADDVKTAIAASLQGELDLQELEYSAANQLTPEITGIKEKGEKGPAGTPKPVEPSQPSLDFGPFKTPRARPAPTAEAAPEAAPSTVLDTNTLDSIGLPRQSGYYRQLVNKDVANPKDQEAVRNILAAVRQNPNLSPFTKQAIESIAIQAFNALATQQTFLGPRGGILKGANDGRVRSGPTGGVSGTGVPISSKQAPTEPTKRTRTPKQQRVDSTTESADKSGSGEKLPRSALKKKANVLEHDGIEYADTPRIRTLIEKAKDIQAKLPSVKSGMVRLYRGNREGEVGQNPSFTNSLVGIALPFQESYGGSLSYVDIPEADLSSYDAGPGSAPGAEFILPKEIANKAKPVTPAKEQKAKPVAPPPAKKATKEPENIPVNAYTKALRKRLNAVNDRLRTETDPIEKELLRDEIEELKLNLSDAAINPPEDAEPGTEGRFRTGEGTGMDKADVQKYIANEIKDWKNAPPVKVVETENQLPDYLQEQIKNENVVNPKGVWDPRTQSVFLISSNLTNNHDATYTVLHEIMGHFGLQKILGSKFDKVMGDIYNSNKAVKDRADNKIANGMDKLVAVEEVLAEMAETATNPSLIQKVVNIIRQALKALGFDINTFTNGEILQLLQDSRKFVTGTEGTPIGGNVKFGAVFNSDAPIFYSQLASMVAGAPKQFNLAPKEQWAAWFESMKKNGKVKGEELAYTGVLDFLNTTSGKISRDDLLEFLNQEGVKVEETMYGANTISEEQRKRRRQEYDREYSQAIKPYADADDKAKKDLKKFADNIFTRLGSGEIKLSQLISKDRYEKRTKRDGDHEYAFANELADGTFPNYGLYRNTKKWMVMQNGDFDTYSIYNTGPNASDNSVDGVKYKTIDEAREALESLRDDYRENYDPNGVDIFSEYEKLLTAEREAEFAYERFVESYPELEDDSDRTAYSSYTMESGGGKNYRELILSLPVKKVEAKVVEYSDGITNLFRVVDTKGNILVDDIFMRETAENIKADLERGDSLYKHGHWKDVANPVVHIRFNEKTDAQGNRVLFVEELQSDWGQAFSLPEGYKLLDLRVPKENAEARKIMGDSDIDFVTSYSPDTDPVMAGAFNVNFVYTNGTNYQLVDYGRYSDKPNTKKEAMRVLMDDNVIPRVEEAPFVTEPRSYTALAIKRLLRYAADNGYDKISFISGLEAHKRFPTARGGRSTEKGMKTHYDERIPSVVKTVFNQLGVAPNTRTEEIQIPNSGREIYVKLLTGGERIEGPFKSREEAEDVIIDVYTSLYGTPKLVQDLVDPETQQVVASKGDRLSGVRLSNMVNRGYSIQFLLNSAVEKKMLFEIEHRKVPITKPFFTIDLTLEAREKVKRGQPMFRAGRFSTGAGATFRNNPAAPGVNGNDARTVFDSFADRIESAGILNSERADNLHEFIKNGIFGNARKALLYTLPVKPLTEEAKRAGLKMAPQFNTIIDEQSGYVNSLNRRIEPLVQRAEAWAKGAGQKQIDLFNKVVYDSTILKADPTKPKKADVSQADYDLVKNNYDKLGGAGKSLYVQIRDGYAEMYQEILNSIEDRINTFEIGDDAKSKIKQDILEKLAKQGKIDPYFALTRKGKYWLSYNLKTKRSDGQVTLEPYIEAFTTERERKKQAALIEKEGATDIQAFSQISQYRYSRAPSGSFVNNMLNILELNKPKGLSKEATDKYNEAADEVMRLYLSTLPETSFAQSFQKRKEVLGFKRDAIEAMRDRMYSTSQQLGRMRYSAKLNKLLEDMREYSKLVSKGIGEEGEKIPPQDNKLMNEYIGVLEKHAETINNPNVSNISRLINSLGFNYLLGLNVSSAVINMGQVPMVVAPYLAGEHGWGETMSAINRAYKLYLNSGYGKNARTVEVIGTEKRDLNGNITTPAEKVKQSGMPSITNYDPNSAEGKKYDTLIEQAQKQGQINQSQFYDILEVDGRKNFGSTVNAVTGFAFHHGDRINREVSMVAAYDLQLAKLNKNKPKGLSKEESKAFEKQAEIEAANYAIYVTEMTNGGVSAASSPLIAKGNVGRVLFMFKRYGVSMYYMLFKITREALKGETPEIRKAAMRQIAGVYGTSALFSGLQGVPMFGVAAMVYNLFAEEDEDDFETATRKYVGEFAYKGMLNYVTGAEVASRFSLSDLIFRSNPTANSRTFEQALLENVGGPAYGVMSRIKRGLDFMSEGNMERGIENILPSAMSNLFKAYRFGTEGAQSLRGDPIVEDINAFSVAAQALGFAPADYVRQLEINSNLKGIEKSILQEKSKLLQKWNVATRMGDTEDANEYKEDLFELNKKHPDLKISEDTFERSERAFKAATKRTVNGVQFSQKLYDEMMRNAAEYEK